ncbi:hypothetical protein YZOS03_29490 [Vibrio alginolyticus]|nr:hypothetical protein YZOS03_29490 [Vibrio alginolyticus]BDR19750.1 hypothetical protein VspSTUT16_30960 [Vibrio sp. STUT-A16]
MHALTVAHNHITLLAQTVASAFSFTPGSNILNTAITQIASEQTAELRITKEALKKNNKYANMIVKQQ